MQEEKEIHSTQTHVDMYEFTHHPREHTRTEYITRIKHTDTVWMHTLTSRQFRLLSYNSPHSALTNVNGTMYT